MSEKKNVKHDSTILYTNFHPILGFTYALACNFLIRGIVKFRQKENKEGNVFEMVAFSFILLNRRFDTLRMSPFLTRDICDSLFVFLHTKPLLKRPFREDPVFKGKIKKMTVASLVSIFIPLNNIEITDHPVCRYDFSLNFLLQTNFNSLNTDGSFTMANSNSFLNPYEILTIAQETNI